MLEEIDKHQLSLGVVDMSLSITTLEEVFLQVTHKAELTLTLIDRVNLFVSSSTWAKLVWRCLLEVTIPSTQCDPQIVTQ